MSSTKPGSVLLVGLLSFLPLTPLCGQSEKPNVEKVGIAASEGSPFKPFSLDFRGGSARQLILAIETSLNTNLNVIVLDKDSDVQLPPLKVRNVRLPDLFRTLNAASAKTEYVTMLNSSGFTSTTGFTTGYEFTTPDPHPGPSSVWFFHVSRVPAPPTPPPVCRFYSLAPYLDLGLTVDDITTAIQTGWKMEGDTTLPQLCYHKETKLLIAVGQPSKLETISAVLRALEPPRPVDPTTGLPIPASKSVKAP